MVITTALLIYIAINIGNVLIHTLSNVLTVRGSKFVAGLTCAISYTFYAGIVKLMSGYSIEVVLIVMFLTYLIFTPIGKFIADKFSVKKNYHFIIGSSDKIKLEKIQSFAKYLNCESWVSENIINVNITGKEKKSLEQECNRLNLKYTILIRE